MSAIFGFCTIDNSDNGIKQMLPWNRPYGMFKEALFACDKVSIGCCVEKLSDNHIQTVPVINDGDCHAVIDAVIYNREDIIAECEVSEDISDAELLYMHIKKSGLTALKNINGDFAGAIYDAHNDRLTLFRDHMGVRPLFFYKDKCTVAFSTDIRGLLALPLVKTQVIEEWIYKTVSGFDTDTLLGTPYEGVECVPPASFLQFSCTNWNEEISVTEYWRIGSTKIRKKTDEEYIAGLRELITDSVNRRLNAVSGLVGAEMSGGLDSSVIDILINRAGRECIYYSWSKDPSEVPMAEHDERLIVGEICKRENISCYYSHLSDNYEHGMEEVARNAEINVPENGSGDFRFAFPSNSNTYQIIYASQFVKSKGANVIFTGHGGDEGVSHRSNIYEMYAHHEYYHYWRYLWSVTRGKNRIFRTLKKGLTNIAESKKSLKETYLNWFESPELLKEDFARQFKIKKESALLFEFDPIGYIKSGGSRNRLDNMALFGAYSGVRYLVPFFDYRVIDYAVSIPRYLYAHKGVKRYIYREAFKDIIPKSLYRLNEKEDMSLRNIPVRDSWQEEYARRKREIIESLDREYWGKYLDFAEIDVHLSKDYPPEEEYEEEMRHLKAILKCALAHNLYKKARENT